MTHALVLGALLKGNVLKHVKRLKG